MSNLVAHRARDPRWLRLCSDWRELVWAKTGHAAPLWGMWVQIPPPAPFLIVNYVTIFIFFSPRFKKRHISSFYFQRAYEDKNVINEASAKLSSQIDSERRDAFWKIHLRWEPTHSMSILEKRLPKLESQPTFTKLLKEMKKSDSEFESSLAVANYAYYFMQRGKVELFPQIQLSNNVKKTPDLLAILEERPIYVEVTTPEMSQSLKNSFGNIVGIKQRAPGQILDEYEENFEQAVERGDA